MDRGYDVATEIFYPITCSRVMTEGTLIIGQVIVVFYTLGSR